MTATDSNREPQAPTGDGLLLAGRYRLGPLIGRGGMAEVYEGEDVRLRRRVAIKLVPAAPAGEPALADRFLREAQAAASLSHPNIVNVYDGGEDGGQRFIVMEYVEGESLQRRLDAEGPLPVEEAIEVALQLAGALAYAHQQGVVHCDVNPRNVMLRSDRAVKLVDFGIARAAASTSSLMTIPLGTVQYLAPEQVEGQAPDAQTDVYALGLVIYAMLVGQPPFHDPNPWVAAVQRLKVAPEPLGRRNPTVPPETETVVMRAIDRDRARRYASATELATALRGAARSTAWQPTVRLPQSFPGTTRIPRQSPPPTPTPGRTPARRGLRSRLLSLVLLLLFLPLLGGGLLLGRKVLDAGAAPLVPVPAVEGKRLDEATREIHALGLQIQDELVASSQPVGTVLQQDPPPDTEIRQGSKVTLTVSRGGGP